MFSSTAPVGMMGGGFNMTHPSALMQGGTATMPLGASVPMQMMANPQQVQQQQQPPHMTQQPGVQQHVTR
eukprot:NODE_1632_length_429_cov_157.466887_g1622_i0.p2 GENE.NODE_1632_length_429_cov_157.466887_g1622_i0~~NODE_1632_length_429_cov_157.466887_g1622_i0.p2  ORF type:complete len:80 (-),score=38.04 NODE_1632_length_429_cov_157.466887_g1622_i0:188-397(-)